MAEHNLVLRIGEIELRATLDDSETAKRIAETLPLEARAHRWGDEIYFEIPLSVPEAPNARDVMEVGELAYWPPGRAFCIFFGPTPVSRADEPRAASAVNPVGRVLGDTDPLRNVSSGTKVTLQSATK